MLVALFWPARHDLQFIVRPCESTDEMSRKRRVICKPICRHPGTVRRLHMSAGDFRWSAFRA